MFGVSENFVKKVKFKFQYGATNIVKAQKLASSTNSFKFQYGATNI